VQPLVRYDLGDSVVAAVGPCPCGSPLPAIRVQGRCDDVLRFPGRAGHQVAVAPLTIGSVTDDVPGLARSQLVQTSPSTLRVRLQATPGANVETVWDAVRSRLADYLTAQDVADVELVRAEEPPEQSLASGKFRQVIATAQPGTPAP
jgi:phenylacetate-coenzyme A ligase PaaK-like adenylate-forming protein